MAPPPPWPKGDLEVTVLSATALPKVVRFGHQSPYVTLRLLHPRPGGAGKDAPRTERDTRAHKGGGAEPVWNQTLLLPLRHGEQALGVQVRNDASLGVDSTIARAEISLAQVYDQKACEGTYSLLTKEGNQSGIIRLRLLFRPALHVGVAAPPHEPSRPPEAARPAAARGEAPVAPGVGLAQNDSPPQRRVDASGAAVMSSAAPFSAGTWNPSSLGHSAGPAAASEHGQPFGGQEVPDLMTGDSYGPPSVSSGPSPTWAGGSPLYPSVVTRPPPEKERRNFEPSPLAYHGPMPGRAAYLNLGGKQ